MPKGMERQQEIHTKNKPQTSRQRSYTRESWLKSNPSGSVMEERKTLLWSQPFKIEAIRCTVPNCRCDCFSPGKGLSRTCENCKHGWVAHALDKLGYKTMYQLGMQVELVQPNIVFDIASLILYGSQATPIRLKILLDRLFSVLQHEEVLQVLHGFGWSYEDYARGYILQDPTGRVLDKWTVTTREEEQIIIQQFLRFGETKSIAQEIILQDAREHRAKDTAQTPKTESEIKKFIERSNVGMQSFMRSYDGRPFLGRPPSYPPSSLSSSSSRLISPPLLQQYSPTGSNREQLVALPLTSSSPVSGSPLSRLQTMQPFDYRKDRHSPNVSPVISEKSHANIRKEAPSPQNLSITSPAVLTPTSQHIPVQSQNHHSSPSIAVVPGVITPPKGEHNEEIRYTVSAEPRPPSSDEALDFSTKDSGPPIPAMPSLPHMSSSSVYADRKIKHLRKSANPIKRQWQPNPSFGHTFISPSGKKRVLCTACNKTFCDKGALKIHYSAVHLKEMHKCTVDGCNMMFSSRRSRNRHSANPNPKLHMPQTKRKLTDGSSSMDEDCRSPPTSLPPSVLPSPTKPETIMQGMLPTDFKASVPRLDPITTQAKSTPITASDLGLFMAHGHHMAPRYHNPPKMPKLDFEDEPNVKPIVIQPVENTSRSARKRKGFAPTRCTQMEQVYVMSDGENEADEMDEASAISRSELDDSMEAENLSLRSGEPMYMEDDSMKDDESKQSDNEFNMEEPSKNGVGPEAMESQKRSRRYSDTTEEDSGTRMEPMGDVEDNMDPDMPHQLGLQRTTSNNHSDNEDKPADHCEGNCSDMDESNLSIGSNNSQSGLNGGTNGDKSDSDSADIPLDKDNPKRCPTCGKVFQNHFTVKTHYQNVHLKLMHTCSVEGCNAAFPSKRSRDRHSSNLNLHRKLLSTSSDGESSGTRTRLNQSLRDEFLNRIYDNQSLNPDVPSCYPKESEPETNGFNAGISLRQKHALCNENGDEENYAQVPSPEDSHVKINGKTNGHEDIETDSSTINNFDESIDDLPRPDPDGMVTCHVCEQKFRDNLRLKEHFEKVHPKEMYHCTITGCDKIFSTRKSRNRHSQNDNLHRHLSPSKVACVP